MKHQIQTLDCIALNRDFPEHNLVSGQVGAVVDKLGANHYEVEFCSNDGQTYALAAFPADALLVLLFEPIAA